jgi:hypothetical protein
MRSFAVEVTADNTGKFYGNSLRFASREEAKSYAADKMWNWTAVRDTRVIETTDPVNYIYNDHQLIPAGEE